MKQTPIKAKIDDSVSEGTYANLMNVIYSPAEFILDFGRMVPGKQEVSIVSRIITSPMHIKIFLKVIGDHIKQYEDKFGEIKTFIEKDSSSKIGF
jgi:hypothetical protein